MMDNHNDSLSLEGRVAIVTGGAQGIGLGIAKALVLEGATVVIGDLDEMGGIQAAQSFADQGFDATAIPLDVRRITSCQTFTRDVLNKHGKIDIWINNAGIFIGETAEETTPESWDLQLEVMLSGILRCSQVVALTAMIPQRYGVIVNIASIGGFGGWPLRLAYNTAKAGVISMTQGMATEWAQYGIRVNAISPGITRTEMIEEMIQKGISSREKYCRRIPLGRLAEVDEIASSVLFLASDRSSYITGENLVVDGGWIAWANPYGLGWPEEDEDDG